MAKEDQANKTPIVDLMNSALKDYEAASAAVHHYNSDIPKAIKYYFIEKINKEASKELKNDLEDLQTLLKWEKRIFSFDYISNVSRNEDGYFVGETKTEEIEAYDAGHATLIFKCMHPNKPFDPPY